MSSILVENLSAESPLGQACGNVIATRLFCEGLRGGPVSVHVIPEAKAPGHARPA